MAGWPAWQKHRTYIHNVQQQPALPFSILVQCWLICTLLILMRGYFRRCEWRIDVAWLGMLVLIRCSGHNCTIYECTEHSLVLLLLPFVERCQAPMHIMTIECIYIFYNSTADYESPFVLHFVSSHCFLKYSSGTLSGMWHSEKIYGVQRQYFWSWLSCFCYPHPLLGWATFIVVSHFVLIKLEANIFINQTQFSNSSLTSQIQKWWLWNINSTQPKCRSQYEIIYL